MKKVLWIACLLLVMPFLGYAQNHAGFATQNDEAIFGPGPVSKELPSRLQMNLMKGRDAGDAIWAHAMFVPEQNHHYGYYYSVAENGAIQTVRRFDNFYFSSAEYYKPFPASDDDEMFPVWAYADDLTKGFHRLMYVDGTDNNKLNPTAKNMLELTYDYYHNAPGQEGRMLGMQYGKIYLVNMDWNTDYAGSVELLYDPADHPGIGRPITLACNLAGEVFFISVSEDGTSTSKLYKFEADDENLEDPFEIGEVNWAAQHIQTMAFDHKDFDRLVWWQCDKDNNTNLVEVDPETGATTLIAATGKTEMAGLIFEFEYRPYMAYCTPSENGTIKLNKVNAAGEFTNQYTETQQGYKPAKIVKFKVENEECYELDRVYVKNRETHEVLYTIEAAELDANLVGQFAMPAFDVDIEGEWHGVDHHVTLNVVLTPGNTGTSTTGWLTIDGSADVENEATVTLHYAHPAGWFLTDLTAKKGNTPVAITVTNKEEGIATFTMPCGNVTVTAKYNQITLDNLNPICQWQGILSNNAHVPESPHTLTAAHAHSFDFIDPNGTTHHYENSPGLYGPAAYTEMDNMLAALTFDIAGTWYYNTYFTSQKYGAFATETKSFQVYAAPKTIAIKEQIKISDDPELYYNAHYNCDGDSIHLEIVADPADYTFNGTFTWMKDGAEVATTTEPLLVINPCTVDDAGIYNVTYNPATEGTAEAPCEFTLNEPFEVNVATIPNTPIIVLDGANPICYHSVATLRWDYGVLKPDAYDIRWFTIDDAGTWTQIEGESDVVLATAVLDASATYGLSIAYAYPGHYNLCHRESDPFTINVKPEVTLEIGGDTETCKGIVPENNPYVIGDDFETFTWSFNGEVLGETSNTLHFENYALNGNHLNNPGTFWVEVSAVDVDGCVIYGEFQFTVNDLPDVAIANNITDAIAHPNDNPVVQIEICAGDLVELTGMNASVYNWGEIGGPVTGAVFTDTPTENTTYQLWGTNDETGCWNSASIEVIVHQRPVITWVVPAEDGQVYSMIDDPIQLVATPAGGEFTWIDPLDPLGIGHEIPGGLLIPSLLPVGEYQLAYRYTDEFGCSNEDKVRNISIVKPYWSDPEYWNPDWYEECTVHKGRFEITSPADMGSFWAYVYGLNTEYGVVKTDFANDTIWLENDIDLREEPVFSRPLCAESTFKGVFDGTGHVLTNMTVLENDLDMRVDGFVRNVGVRHAMITSVGAPCVVDVVDGARFHNSYITMPELNNVAPKLNPYEAILPTGEVRNVYYYGLVPGAPAPFDAMPLPVYMESTEMPQVQLPPTINSNTLLHAVGDDYEGILEEWVWLQNDFYYRTWVTDASDPSDYANYGYPFHGDAFIHHHYITVNACDEIADVAIAGAQTRTIKGTEYTYAKNGDAITLTFTPNKYVKVDEVTLTLAGYHGGADVVLPATVNPDGVTCTFNMPLDSVYMPAYDLNIDVTCRRDYWTDGDGNIANDYWDGQWYDNQLLKGRFEIQNNRELAAFAHAVLFENHSFEDTTIYVIGSETVGSELIDMTGHFWMPVQGFKGILDGTHFIVDNLYIREALSAMFVNLDGVVRNLGLQDVDLDREAAEGTIATFAINDTPDFNGTVVNGFATADPTLGQFTPLAVGETVTVTNCYTLDEGGNMIDHAGNGTDIGLLEAWVEGMNSEDYWTWKTDDANINYHYPIHDGMFDAGWTITYDPDIFTFNADPVGTPGYVDGPTTGHTGEEITIGTFPKPCYNNLEHLYVDGVELIGTKKFIMPDHPVTVSAAFSPIHRNLTINYIVDDDPSMNPAPYVNNTIVYNDHYAVTSPLLADYETEDLVVEGDMPCGDKVIDVHYVGKFHNINFCEFVTANAESYTTDHYDATLEVNRARFNDMVHVDIVAPAGLSIPQDGVSIETADGSPIDWTGFNGHYDFEMPSDDVVICVFFDEEYWDDYGIADIEWFIGNEDADTYVLTTDSMLGGLAALTSSRPWLVEEGYYTAEEVATFDFAGKTILVESAQEEGMIDLIEHKWRPIGAQISYTKFFQGYFDGQNTEIVNMRTADFTVYDEPGNGSCQAFFGNVGEDAVITNLHIEGVATGRYFTAGIAGVNYGLIMNSVATVKVKSEFEAGGIVGNNLGILINDYCNADSVICLAAMPLTKDGDNNYYVGGVAAANGGIIDNCHSVAFLHRAGTLGNNPTNYYGGVVGMNESDMVSYCYWKVNPVAEGIGGGIALNNSAVISNSTAAAMNTRAPQLEAEYGVELNGWKQGTEGYPVFDLDRMIMSNNEHEINVELYPNPTKDVIYIISENIQNVTVYNMFGQMVLDTKVNANQTSINMSSFAAGMYMVRITTADGVSTQNVVVE